MLQVTGAQTLNSQTVRVTFNEPLLSIPDPTDPFNYSLYGLTISQIVMDGTSAVRIYTDAHFYDSYLVIVSNLRGVGPDPLDPLHNRALFTGYTADPKYLATAQSRRKIQLVFLQRMFHNGDFSDPANYTVTDLNGISIPVVSVTPHLSLWYGVRVTLALGGDLTPGLPYRVNVGPAVVAYWGRMSILPSSVIFQWYEEPLVLRVPRSLFQKGSGGPLRKQGVFFSPAYNSVANSSLQVDWLSVCTRAYDVYHMPQPVDPKILYTFGGLTPGVLNREVLLGPFEVIEGASFDISDKRAETMPHAVDSHCIAKIKPQWDPTLVSLIGDTDPTHPGLIFDGVSLIPFKTADLTGPLPPGTETTITLEP